MTCSTLTSTIRLTQGDTFQFVASVTSGGVAVDLTGASAVFTMKKSISDTVATISENCTISDAVNGKIQVSVAPTLTNITEGSYRWEIQITDAGGHVMTTPMQTILILPQLA